MHILSQLPIAMPEKDFQGYYDLLKRAYELTKEPETQVTIEDVPHGVHDPGMLNYYGPREINGQEMVRCMLQAEQRGFDAIAGACYFDTGISTVANFLTIPVIGPAKAAMNMAALIGSCFSVITTEPMWVPELEHAIFSSEFSSKSLRSCPVKTLDASMHQTVENLFAGSYEPIKQDFQKNAQYLIAQGADVLIAGCGLISPLFTVQEKAEIDGVPIIDPMVAALKFAEFMVQIQKKNISIKSQKGRFAHPPQKILESMIV